MEVNDEEAKGNPGLGYWCLRHDCLGTECADQSHGAVTPVDWRKEPAPEDEPT